MLPSFLQARKAGGTELLERSSFRADLHLAQTLAPPTAAQEGDKPQRRDQQGVAGDVKRLTEALQSLREKGMGCAVLGSGQIVLYDPPMGDSPATLGSLVSHEATDCILVIQPGPRRIPASSGTWCWARLT